MDNEKVRQSGEQERKDPAEPMLPTVNPLTEKPEAPKASLHPAFYIATWITLSSGTILFNKWQVIAWRLLFTYRLFG